MLRDREPLQLPCDAEEERGREMAYRWSAIFLIAFLVGAIVARCAGC